MYKSSKMPSIMQIHCSANTSRKLHCTQCNNTVSNLLEIWKKYSNRKKKASSYLYTLTFSELVKLSISIFISAYIRTKFYEVKTHYTVCFTHKNCTEIHTRMKNKLSKLKKTTTVSAIRLFSCLWVVLNSLPLPRSNTHCTVQWDAS